MAPPVLTAPTRYITPTDLWQLALPPVAMFAQGKAPAPLDPGRCYNLTSNTSHGSTGSMTPGGVPHDSHHIRLEVVEAGEVNRYNIVNPGVLPSFRVSVDGVVRFDRRVGTQNDEAFLDVPEYGFRVGVTKGWALLDWVEFDTEPSPDVVAKIDVACSLVDNFICGSWNLPLKRFGKVLQDVVASEARWGLLEKSGLAGAQQYQLYLPDRLKPAPMSTWCWLLRAQAGEWKRDPAFEGTPAPGGSDSFPNLVTPPRVPPGFPI